MEKRGSYEKGDKEVNKLVKKARQSDVRRKNLDTDWEKKMKSLENTSPEYLNKKKNELKKIEKKIDADHKRESRRDERYMSKKK